MKKIRKKQRNSGLSSRKIDFKPKNLVFRLFSFVILFNMNKENIAKLMNKIQILC